MRITAESSLKAFAAKHPDAAASLDRWIAVMSEAACNTPAEVQAVLGASKVVSHDRLRFGVTGGNYRLIVGFKFKNQIAFVKFIGTRAEYDSVDATAVSQF